MLESLLCSNLCAQKRHVCGRVEHNFNIETGHVQKQALYTKVFQYLKTALYTQFLLKNNLLKLSLSPSSTVPINTMVYLNKLLLLITDQEN